MTEQTKELIALATKLPPGERITLVEEILSSLDQPDAAMDRLWAKEAEDRLAAMDHPSREDSAESIAAKAEMYRLLGHREQSARALKEALACPGSGGVC